MFTGTNILEFTQRFRTKDDCLNYLSDIKWKDGFRCVKCGHQIWSKTVKPYVRKCNCCKHKESPTAGTLFHKCKFDLTKAFMIVYLMSCTKKSVSSYELQRQLSLRQKTCWLFQHKVRQAMKSSKMFPLKNKVVVDEFQVGGPQKGKRGRSKSKKKQVVIAIEHDQFGIHRCYAHQIDGAGTKQLKPLFEDHIAPQAEVKTDKWRGYRPLMKQYPNLTQIESAKGKNFPLIHRQIMMFKGWLRGIHHHCERLQNYLDEYCYRFNRLKWPKTIFHKLVERMMEAPPKNYNKLKIEWGI